MRNIGILLLLAMPAVSVSGCRMGGKKTHFVDLDPHRRIDPGDPLPSFDQYSDEGNDSFSGSLVEGIVDGMFDMMIDAICGDD